METHFEWCGDFDSQVLAVIGLRFFRNTTSLGVFIGSLADHLS
jgi:hypothetical protein